jgi:hypothetical protein
LTFGYASSISAAFFYYSLSVKIVVLMDRWGLLCIDVSRYLYTFVNIHLKSTHTYIYKVGLEKKGSLQWLRVIRNIFKVVCFSSSVCMVLVKVNWASSTLIDRIYLSSFRCHVCKFSFSFCFIWHVVFVLFCFDRLFIR